MKKIEKIRTWYKQLKDSKKCSYCGEANSKCLDFHHIIPKTKKSSISRMVNTGRDKSAIKKEMKKCWILCSNCHRKEHQNQRDKNKRLRRLNKVEKYVLDLKLRSVCACGEATSCCLDFHHIDPRTKLFNLGDLFKIKKVLKEVKAEIAKCEIICSNCHRKKH